MIGQFFEISSPIFSFLLLLLFPLFSAFKEFPLTMKLVTTSLLLRFLSWVETSPLALTGGTQIGLWIADPRFVDELLDGIFVGTGSLGVGAGVIEGVAVGVDWDGDGRLQPLLHVLSTLSCDAALYQIKNKSLIFTKILE